MSELSNVEKLGRFGIGSGTRGEFALGTYPQNRTARHQYF